MTHPTSNLRTALAEWDRLRYPKDVMRDEGITFGDVLTLRGNAIDRLIEAVRAALSGDSSVPQIPTPERSIVETFARSPRRVTDETKASECNVKLDELAALPHNWDSYGGIPPRGDCLAKARQIAPLLPGAWSIVPMSNGGIQLEQHSSGLDIELMIEGASAQETTGDIERLNDLLKQPRSGKPEKALGGPVWRFAEGDHVRFIDPALNHCEWVVLRARSGPHDPCYDIYSANDRTFTHWAFDKDLRAVNGKAES